MTQRSIWAGVAKFASILCAVGFTGLGTACSGDDLDPLTGEVAKSNIVFTEWVYNSAWIAQADGSNVRKLHSDVQSGVKFSPDGTMLTFNISNNVHLVTDLNGKTLHQFTGCLKSDDFSWTPDGNQILFGCYDDGLYRYDLTDGSLTRFYTTRTDTYDHNPVMSPDQTRIVFTHHEFGTAYTIFVVNPDGSNVVSIATGRSADHDVSLNLAWVDLTHVAFTVLNYPVSQIHVIDLDAVTDASIEINDASFNGITLTSDKQTVAAHGGGLRLAPASGLLAGSLQLTPVPHINASGHFAWSGDGAHVVVNGGQEATSDSADRILSVFDTSGKEYRFLTSGDFPGKVTCADVQTVDWGAIPN